jgi:P-type Ca2+ transporter type 2C
MPTHEPVEKRPPSGAENSVYTGLTKAEAARLRAEYGPNRLEGVKKNAFLASLWHVAQEPMFILLAVACLLYFFLGDLTEAIMMLVSIAFVATIEIIQETKSERALEALRRYTEAKIRVLRDGIWMELESENLVPGDVVALSEGERIPADGLVLQQNDLSVDESVLTGESLPVEKMAGAAGVEGGRLKVEDKQKNTTLPRPLSSAFDPPFASLLYQGTTVAGGKGVMRVTATGNRTEFGKLGKSIESIEKSDTPLQRQITQFVRFMGIFGVVAFLLVFALNLWQAHDFWKALLFSLTVAMALIPEEIPVAFTTFMGLGAYRMIQHGILAKQPKTVESLGSATVICLDKTGTITENKMSVADVHDFSDKNRTLEWAFWASEPEPFDAMEQAIEERWKAEGSGSKGGGRVTDLREGWNLVKEYALSGRPPMMTHVWENRKGARIIAAKGALERVMDICKLEEDARKKIQDHAAELAGRGYRVLGVAGAEFSVAEFPKTQDDFAWTMEGLVAFYDPPKDNVGRVFREFHRAGIRVIMITGDHAETAKNIARSTGLIGWEVAMTGKEVLELDDAALRDAVRRVNVFARMFPDAKLRVVEALKANGETVAMSGDGVNDGPALKAAQIGVAMGKKGTEIAKTAASLVLLSDNLHGMVTAVKMGRRIYDNLRKAIRYVISIHIPIILLVLVPLILNWPYPHILLPLHVIFLELVMDPTAAIAFENEPAERNLMRKPPRPGNTALFTWSELGISLLQGGFIALFVLGMYQYALSIGRTEDGVRSFVFATLVMSNLFLTLANRSFDYTFWHTMRYKNNTLPLILAVSILMLLAILYVPPISGVFRLEALSLRDFGLCAAAGLASVLWFELYKALKPVQNNRNGGV